ncbi:hypothetical protein BU26DRAFT_340533 [Trematosphaeria pertusa]|uniref:Uncharacterized protein n=1 Tax=Trematosphaeria pertusa TaxID=390896 RepID=A0A6A6I9Y4_9PLEO|nr:uncharacterized protein BU26DRAFT_340533 [Trematosphaeria pertusa]KAF2247039.1 hypothetical protein BU26DRAFT_340533 [Trematosphaeria pertusa]
MARGDFSNRSRRPLGLPRVPDSQPHTYSIGNCAEILYITHFSRKDRLPESRTYTSIDRPHSNFAPHPMVDPLSVASSIAGLVSLGKVTFLRLFHSVKDIKNAEKGVIDLESDPTLNGVLYYFLVIAQVLETG